MSPPTFVYASTCTQIRDKCADQGYTGILDSLDILRLKVWIPRGAIYVYMYIIYIYIYI